MHKFVCGLCALASMVWAFPVHAQATGPAQATAPAIELAFMPQTSVVILRLRSCLLYTSDAADGIPLDTG